MGEMRISRPNVLAAVDPIHLLSLLCMEHGTDKYILVTLAARM